MQDPTTIQSTMFHCSICSERSRHKFGDDKLGKCEKPRKKLHKHIVYIYRSTQLLRPWTAQGGWVMTIKRHHGQPSWVQNIQHIINYKWWFDPISWQRLRLAQPPNQSHHWWIERETVARTISETSFLWDDAYCSQEKDLRSVQSFVNAGSPKKHLPKESHLMYLQIQVYQLP